MERFRLCSIQSLGHRISRNLFPLILRRRPFPVITFHEDSFEDDSLTLDELRERIAAEAAHYDEPISNNEPSKGIPFRRGNSAPCEGGGGGGNPDVRAPRALRPSISLSDVLGAVRTKARQELKPSGEGGIPSTGGVGAGSDSDDQGSRSPAASLSGQGHPQVPDKRFSSMANSAEAEYGSVDGLQREQDWSDHKDSEDRHDNGVDKLGSDSVSRVGGGREREEEEGAFEGGAEDNGAARRALESDDGDNRNGVNSDTLLIGFNGGDGHTRDDLVVDNATLGKEHEEIREKQEVIAKNGEPWAQHMVTEQRGERVEVANGIAHGENQAKECQGRASKSGCCDSSSIESSANLKAEESVKSAKLNELEAAEAPVSDDGAMQVSVKPSSKAVIVDLSPAEDDSIGVPNIEDGAMPAQVEQGAIGDDAHAQRRHDSGLACIDRGTSGEGGEKNNQGSGMYRTPDGEALGNSGERVHRVKKGEDGRMSGAVRNDSEQDENQVPHHDADHRREERTDEDTVGGSGLIGSQLEGNESTDCVGEKLETTAREERTSASSETSGSEPAQAAEKAGAAHVNSSCDLLPWSGQLISKENQQQHETLEPSSETGPTETGPTEDVVRSNGKSSRVAITGRSRTTDVGSGSGSSKDTGPQPSKPDVDSHIPLDAVGRDAKEDLVISSVVLTLVEQEDRLENQQQVEEEPLLRQKDGVVEDSDPRTSGTTESGQKKSFTAGSGSQGVRDSILTITTQDEVETACGERVCGGYGSVQETVKDEETLALTGVKGGDTQKMRSQACNVDNFAIDASSSDRESQVGDEEQVGEDTRVGRSDTIEEHAHRHEEDFRLASVESQCSEQPMGFAKGENAANEVRYEHQREETLGAKAEHVPLLDEIVDDDVDLLVEREDRPLKTDVPSKENEPRQPDERGLDEESKTPADRYTFPDEDVPAREDISPDTPNSVGGEEGAYQPAERQRESVPRVGKHSLDIVRPQLALNDEPTKSGRLGHDGLENSAIAGAGEIASAGLPTGDALEPLPVEIMKTGGDHIPDQAASEDEQQDKGCTDDVDQGVTDEKRCEVIRAPPFQGDTGGIGEDGKVASVSPDLAATRIQATCRRRAARFAVQERKTALRRRQQFEKRRAEEECAAVVIQTRQRALVIRRARTAEISARRDGQFRFGPGFRNCSDRSPRERSQALGAGQAGSSIAPTRASCSLSLEVEVGQRRSHQLMKSHHRCELEVDEAKRRGLAATKIQAHARRRAAARRTANVALRIKRGSRGDHAADTDNGESSVTNMKTASEPIAAASGAAVLSPSDVVPLRRVPTVARAPLAILRQLRAPPEPNPNAAMTQFNLRVTIRSAIEAHKRKTGAMRKKAHPLPTLPRWRPNQSPRRNHTAQHSRSVRGPLVKPRKMSPLHTCVSQTNASMALTKTLRAQPAEPGRAYERLHCALFAAESSVAFEYAGAEQQRPQEQEQEDVVGSVQSTRKAEEDSSVAVAPQVGFPPDVG